MNWPEGVALELVLLGIVWTGFKLCTRSIQRFFDLRHEIRRHMRRFPNAGQPPPDAVASMRPDGRSPTPDRDLMSEAEAFRALGFRMLSFADNARLTFWIVTLMGFDPIQAGDNLISLSHDAGVAFRRQAVADALRFDQDASL